MPNRERTPLYTPHRERHRVYLTVTSTKQNKDDGIHDFLLRKRVFLCLEREKTPKCSACGRNLPPAAPAASRSTATGDPTLDTHPCRLHRDRAGPELRRLHALRSSAENPSSRGRAARAATASGVCESSCSSTVLSAGSSFDSRSRLSRWPRFRFDAAGIGPASTQALCLTGDKHNHGARLVRTVQMVAVCTPNPAPGRQR